MTDQEQNTNKQANKQARSRKIKQFLKYGLLNILIAAVISFLLINYVASAYRINGHSMHSALKHRERIIIYKLGMDEDSINRFDIVVLSKPDDPNKSIIKRVVGLPNELIEIRDGDIYINYQKLEQPFLKDKMDYRYRNENIRPLLIPEHHYFVMGDNRPYSHDSRRFGPIPGQLIHGRTIFRYWPLSRIGKVE